MKAPAQLARMALAIHILNNALKRMRVGDNYNADNEYILEVPVVESAKKITEFFLLQKDAMMEKLEENNNNC